MGVLCFNNPLGHLRTKAIYQFTAIFVNQKFLIILVLNQTGANAFHCTLYANENCTQFLVCAETAASEPPDCLFCSRLRLPISGMPSTWCSCPSRIWNFSLSHRTTQLNGLTATWCVWATFPQLPRHPLWAANQQGSTFVLGIYQSNATSTPRTLLRAAFSIRSAVVSNKLLALLFFYST